MISAQNSQERDLKTRNAENFWTELTALQGAIKMADTVRNILRVKNV